MQPQSDAKPGDAKPGDTDYGTTNPGNARDGYHEDAVQDEADAEFSPKLLWDNGMTALDFPIQWLTVSHQGTVFMGSMFSKTFTGYSIYNGACKGRQSLSTPASCPPIIVNTNAIICDSSTALTSFNAESLVTNWERLPLRPPRSDNDLRQPLPHPRTNKVSPILFGDKIVTLNTDGLALFYHNEAPDKKNFPDFIELSTSPDEEGTFRITPVIKRQVLYACTTAGHLHFVNLNNIQEIGMVKNLPHASSSTICKEVRVPLVAGSNNILLVTMDGTISNYSLFHKMGNDFKGPELRWSQHLPSQHPYHTNHWGVPVLRPLVDEANEAIFINTKDCVHARDYETGAELWRHRVPQGLSCPPLRWSRYLLVVSEPKGNIPAKITALDPSDGHTIASQPLRDAPSCEPVIWTNYLVVGYHNGYAECYDLAGGTTALPKSDTP